MNLGNILVKFNEGVSLAQLLLGGASAIADLIRQGKASATNTHSGEVLSPEQVLAATARAQTQDLATGDAAGGRIEDRHPR